MIEKIIKRLQNIWLGYSDKILHFLFGYLISSLFQSTGYFMVIPAIVAGTLKEYYDLKRDHLPLSAQGIFNADWACTFGGGFASLFVYAVSLYIGVYLPGFIDVVIIR